MSGVNKAILVGNVGNLEQRGSVVKASLATSEKYKDKEGKQVTKVQWHRLTYFGRLAEIAAQYVKKGDKLYIEGTIEYGKYIGDDGTEKYSTDIVVRNMQMLGAKDVGSGPAASKAVDDPEEDIPF